MGYYTQYSLNIYKKSGKELNSNEFSNVAEFLSKHVVEESYALGIRSYDDHWFIENDAPPVKWYDHEADMKETSRCFPDLVFELYGEGEEKGDIWKKYFFNGKVQRASVIISFDSFSERLLVD
jgi:hypothetical protein